MKLSSHTGEILNRRTVYYVAIYGKEHNIACFLSGALSFVANRSDAALFDTKEEAEDLKKASRSLRLVCHYRRRVKYEGIIRCPVSHLSVEVLKRKKSIGLSRCYHRPLQSDIYHSRNLYFKYVLIHNPFGIDRQRKSDFLLQFHKGTIKSPPKTSQR